MIINCVDGIFKNSHENLKMLRLEIETTVWSLLNVVGEVIRIPDARKLKKNFNSVDLSWVYQRWFLCERVLLRLSNVEGKLSSG